MPVLLQLAPGTVFARDFRVERALAEGGMGAVYVVEQLSTGKRRALKIMHAAVVLDAKMRERFAHEARVGARIDSDHVVEVIGAGIDDATGTPWLAMEYLEGETLAARVRARRGLPPGELLELFEQLCHALGAAHAAGVVHCDLKPENVFVARSQRRGAASVVKVLDFGIARLVQDGRTAATVTTAMGSPMWMAPEQAQRGAKVRAATDVWALGLMAFHALTGRPYWRAANVPADAFNVMTLAAEVAGAPLDPPSQRARELGFAGALPPGFDGWFAHCVARDPGARFAHARAALAALRLALAEPGAPAVDAPSSSPPPRGARRSALAAGAASAAVVFVVGLVAIAARRAPSTAAAREAAGDARAPAPAPERGPVEPVVAAPAPAPRPAAREPLGAVVARTNPWLALPGGALAMQVHEVSRGEFARWRDPSHDAPGPDASLPVASVPWDDARAFCAALGGSARLPTRAEWTTALGPRRWLESVPMHGGAVATHGADVAPSGVRDLVSGVREWVADAVGVRRRVMGAAADDLDDEKVERATEGDIASGPSPQVGFRCVRDAR